MECWECNKKGTKQFELKKASDISGYDNISKRWYCNDCYERVAKERKDDRIEYVRLKKKLMFERATRILERQDVDIYEYKEALEAVSDYSKNNPNKFDSSHEMIAAAIIIYNELPVKIHYKVAGVEVDFYIPDMKAVLEVDGFYHEWQKLKDYERDIKVRNELGTDHEVVRIDTKYIEQNAELLVEAIRTMREEKQKIRKANYGVIPEWFAKKHSKK